MIRSSLCALGLMAMLSGRFAWAAITLTNDVIPSSPVGDPWDVGGSVSIGEKLNGIMTINAGSDVTNTDGFVANMTGSNGTVAVNGSGSTWTSSGELRMGNFGTGTLNVVGGGTVSVDGNGRLGNSVGGFGLATVDGAGSTFTSDNYILGGREGSGTLNIQHGGVVSDRIGGIAIFEGSSGAVTIDGAGSAWNNLNELQVADGGAALLEILNGGVATSSLGYLAVSPLGVGVATINGLGSRWNNANELQVGYRGRGTLSVLNGGTVSSALGFVGVLAGGNGAATVSGAGTSWINSGDMSVGYEGAGTLNVLDGATITTGAGYLGALAGSDGTATVSGGGSTWTNSGNLTVGSLGAGTLNIENGGIVIANALDGGTAGSGVNFNGGTLRITATDIASNVFTLNSVGGTLEIPAGAAFTLTSAIVGDGGLTKIGAGALELTGANTYADDTRVVGGALGVNGLNFPDAGDAHISLGATIDLDFVGTDKVNALFFNGVGQATGTWGSPSSGATHRSGIFTGAGLLEVTSFDPGTPGDFDQDNGVDGRDFLIWQQGESFESISASDLADWRANYGRLSSVVTSVAVPEPNTASLLLLATAGGFARRWVALGMPVFSCCSFTVKAVSRPVS